MQIWQHDLVLTYSIFGFLFGLKGWYESSIKKNPYGQYFWLNFWGAFVWADAAILCMFWGIAGFIILYFNNWSLFCLLFSAFWLIRSLGETLYWFLTQFTNLNKDPAEKFFLNKFFPGGAVFFINQMLWQCISIIALLSTIYFAYQWIQSIN
jgi:hypothetical protein